MWCRRRDSNSQNSDFESDTYTNSITSAYTIWSRQQESNLHLTLRRHAFYPLNYSEKNTGTLDETRTRKNTDLNRTRMPIPPPGHVWGDI